MGLRNWLASKITSASIRPTCAEFESEILELYADASYREMAMYTAVDLIAKAISKCEFKTYKGHTETKGEEWYRWNIEPNRNQSSSAFLRKLIFQLYYTGECLVIPFENQILVADSFSRTPYVLYDDVFEQITSSNFSFSGKYRGSDVLYWNLNDTENGKSVQAVLTLACNSYGKLLTYAMKSYQTSRGSKGIFKYEAVPQHVANEDANQWLQGQLKKYGQFIAADGGVATVGKGTDFVPFDKKSTYSNESTRDMRHLVDDISDFTAKAFGIPPALLRGDVQGVSDAMDQFLTFCIDPLADMLREEIVRKTIGKRGFADGYDLTIDTRTIKHIDILSVHGAVEKLVGSGVFSINNVRKMLGERIIDEDWANEHFITRNYATIDEYLKTMEEVKR